MGKAAGRRWAGVQGLQRGSSGKGSALRGPQRRTHCSGPPQREPYPPPVLAIFFFYEYFCFITVAFYFKLGMHTRDSNTHVNIQ